MSKTKIIFSDFQNEFTQPEGKAYKPRPSVGFVKDTLIPFLREKNIRGAEIIADYRQPRPGVKGPWCHPGEWGYESEIPDDVKISPSWVKCMNSPIWVHENRGVPDSEPGTPYEDPDAFGAWLQDVIGKPEDSEGVVLTGLTLDWCLLCTSTELTFRGYKVQILKEATDTHLGDLQVKELICANPPLTNFAKIINWDEFQSNL